MADYRHTVSHYILHTPQGGPNVFVSDDPAAADRVAYDAWLALGNTPDPFVPAVVSPRQARLALNAAGLLGAVTTAVAQADQATQITWEFATEINRHDPLIAAIGGALGLTSSQIDALFIQAATL